MKKFFCKNKYASVFFVLMLVLLLANVSACDNNGDMTDSVDQNAQSVPEGKLFNPDAIGAAGNNGEKIKEIYMHGELMCWYEYEYDEVGNTVKTTRYNADGSIDSLCEYEHDINGNTVKESRYYDGGNECYEMAYEYDDNGNLIKALLYENGTFSGSSDLEYDENGNEVMRREYAADGALISTVATEYIDNGYISQSYNADGILTEKFESRNDGNNTVTYTYLNGILQECVEYTKDEASGNMVYRTYNADNVLVNEDVQDNNYNLIKSIYYNTDGSIAWGTEDIYNDDGRHTKAIFYYDENDTKQVTGKEFVKKREIEYDSQERDVKWTFYNINMEVIKWKVIEYSETGEKETVYDSNGNVSSVEEYTYDETGNRTKK